jgi:Bacterial DNA-binding protein/SPOR domain
MIRFELIKRISEQFGVEEIDAGVFVDGIFGSMITAFKKGKKINIPEFGKFNVVNKTFDGIRQRYVVFSPAKNFADAINKNFSDLEPIVVNAINVKHKEILKVKEVIAETDDEEYLYFEFDSSGEEIQFEEYPVVSPVSEEVFVKKEETEPESVTEEIRQEEAIPAQVLLSEEVFVKEEEPEPEPVPEENAEVSEKPPAEVILDSKTEQSIFTDLKPVIEDENVIDTKPVENIFNEEIAADVISHQTVFADNPIDIILPEGIPLTKFTENPEEQIAENEKVIDEVNHTTSLSIRVNLKDDMNTDNIKEEIFDILVRREEIIKELNVYNTFADTSHDDIIIPVTPVTEIPKYEDLKKDSEDKPEIIETPDIHEVQDKTDFPNFEDLFGSFDKPSVPPESETKEIPKTEDDSDALFTELEKRIRELDELAKKKEELKKIDISSPMSQEMQIFGKLIDDTHVEKKVPEKHEALPEIIIHEPVPEKVESVEPKSLSDALQNMKLDGIIEHLEPDEEVNSYNDVFKNSEHQFKPQFTVEPEEKNTQGKFFKGFLYFFFIFLLAAFSFYIYKTMFTKSSGNQVVDTIGFKKIDSVRALLKKTSDSIEKSDPVNLSAEDDSGQTESVEVKNLYGVIYRQLGKRIYIQNKVFDDLAAANELELKLKSNNLNCLVEGTTKIDNGLEYRVLVGPFKNIEEAMDYYEKHKVILNLIQIMHPSQPNLLVF